VGDSEDSFTKQQFDIIQQIMHHTQQQIATSTASKNSNQKNSSNAKNWNSQQVRIKLYIILLNSIQNNDKVGENNFNLDVYIVEST